jgi:hypothetical protein
MTEVHVLNERGLYLIEGAKPPVFYIDTTDPACPVAARWGGPEHPLNARQTLIGITSHRPFGDPPRTRTDMAPWVLRTGYSIILNTVFDGDRGPEPDIWTLALCTSLVRLGRPEAGE